SVKARGLHNHDHICKERAIGCRLIRYADDFIIISGSPVLLNMIKNKIQVFLAERGLEIHPTKSRVLKLGINTPFDFLGYTFIMLYQTKHIKNKLLHSNTPEYRLEGRP